MIKYSATVASAGTEFSPYLFKGNMIKTIEFCAENGFDAVELHIRKADDINTSSIDKVCQKHNIKISTIGTGLGYTLDGLFLTDNDDIKRGQAIARLKEHIDIASILHCGVIIGSMRGRIPEGHKQDKERAMKNYSESLLLLADYAEKKGVTILLEPVNRYENNFHNSSIEMRDFIKKLGSNKIKILLDTFHMNIEEHGLTGMYDSIKECKDFLGHMHFADSNRRRPGAGHIDFAGILKTLNEINYDGYAAFEYLPWPEPEIASVEGLKYIKSLNISG